MLAVQRSGGDRRLRRTTRDRRCVCLAVGGFSLWFLYCSANLNDTANVRMYVSKQTRFSASGFVDETLEECRSLFCLGELSRTQLKDAVNSAASRSAGCCSARSGSSLLNLILWESRSTFVITLTTTMHNNTLAFSPPMAPLQIHWQGNITG